MYTRKEFIINSAKHCFEFCRSCLSIPLKIEENGTTNSGVIDQEALFMEAMGLGIDPGTMDTRELSGVVALLKSKKQMETEGDGKNNHCNNI